jgi:hypothetical protein
MAARRSSLSFLAASALLPASPGARTATPITSFTTSSAWTPSGDAATDAPVDVLIEEVLAEPSVSMLLHRFGREPAAARTILCAPMTTARRRAATDALLKLFPFCVPTDVFGQLGGFALASRAAGAFAYKLQHMITSMDAEDTTAINAAAAAAIGAGWTTTAIAPQLQIKPDRIWDHYSRARGADTETIDIRARTMQWLAAQTALRETRHDAVEVAAGGGSGGDTGATPGQLAIAAGLHSMRCRSLTGMLHAAAHACSSASDIESIQHAWTVVHTALTTFSKLLNMDSGCSQKCPCTLRCAWRVAHIAAAHVPPTTSLWDSFLEAYRLAPVHMADVIRNAFARNPLVLDEAMLAVFPKLCCMTAADDDSSPFVHPDAALLTDIVASISVHAPVFVDIAARIVPGGDGNAALMAAFATVNAADASIAALLAAVKQLPFLFDTLAARLLAASLADWSDAQLAAGVDSGLAAAMAASPRVRAALVSSRHTVQWDESPVIGSALAAGWGPAFFFVPGICTDALLTKLGRALIFRTPVSVHSADTFELLLTVCERMAAAELVENVLTSWYERHGPAGTSTRARPAASAAWFACLARLAHASDLLTCKLLQDLAPLNGTIEFQTGCCCGARTCTAFVQQVRNLQNDDHAMLLRLLIEFGTCWDAPAWAGVCAYALSAHAHSSVEDWQWAASRLAAGEAAGHFAARADAATSSSNPYTNLLEILRAAAAALATKTIRAISLTAVGIAARVLARVCVLLGVSPVDTAADMRLFVSNLLRVRAATGGGRAFFAVNSSASIMTTLTVLEAAASAGLSAREPADASVLDPLFAHAWSLRPVQTSSAAYASHTERLACLNSIELVAHWATWAAARTAPAREDTQLLYACFKAVLDAPDAQLMLRADDLEAWAAALLYPEWLPALRATFPLCVHVLSSIAVMVSVHTLRGITSVCAALVKRASNVGPAAHAVLDSVLFGAADGTPVPVPLDLYDTLMQPLLTNGPFDQACVIAAIHAAAHKRPCSALVDNLTVWHALFRAAAHTGIVDVAALALLHEASPGCMRAGLCALAVAFDGSWHDATPTEAAAIQATTDLLTARADDARICQAFLIATACGSRDTADAACGSRVRALADALVSAGVLCAAAAVRCMATNSRAPALLIDCVTKLTGAAALAACHAAADQLNVPVFAACVRAAPASVRSQFFVRMLAADVREILVFICFNGLLADAGTQAVADAARSQSTRQRTALLACFSLEEVARGLCNQPPAVFTSAIEAGMGETLCWLAHEVRQCAPDISAALFERCAASNVPPLVTPLIECAVCFECVSPLTQACNMPCCHAFHVKCLMQWFGSSGGRACPMCRAHCAAPPETCFDADVRQWNASPLRMLHALETASVCPPLAAAPDTLLPMPLPMHVLFDDPPDLADADADAPMPDEDFDVPMPDADFDSDDEHLPTDWIAEDE